MAHVSKTVIVLLVKENKTNIGPLLSQFASLLGNFIHISGFHYLTCTSVAQISPLTPNPICSAAYLAQKHF